MFRGKDFKQKDGWSWYWQPAPVFNIPKMDQWWWQCSPSISEVQQWHDELQRSCKSLFSIVPFCTISTTRREPWCLQASFFDVLFSKLCCFGYNPTWMKSSGRMVKFEQEYQCFWAQFHKKMDIKVNRKVNVYCESCFHLGKTPDETHLCQIATIRFIDEYAIIEDNKWKFLDTCKPAIEVEELFPHNKHCMLPECERVGIHFSLIMLDPEALFWILILPPSLVLHMMIWLQS